MANHSYIRELESYDEVQEADESGDDGSPSLQTELFVMPEV